MSRRVPSDDSSRVWRPLDGHAWLQVDVGEHGPAFRCTACNTFVGFAEEIDTLLALRALAGVAGDHFACALARPTSPGGDA